MKEIRRAAAIAIVVFIIDQVIKYWATTTNVFIESNPISLVLAYNTTDRQVYIRQNKDHGQRHTGIIEYFILHPHGAEILAENCDRHSILPPSAVIVKIPHSKTSNQSGTSGKQHIDRARKNI